MLIEHLLFAMHCPKYLENSLVHLVSFLEKTEALRHRGDLYKVTTNSDGFVYKSAKRNSCFFVLPLGF